MNLDSALAAILRAGGVTFRTAHGDRTYNIHQARTRTIRQNPSAHLAIPIRPCHDCEAFCLVEQVLAPQPRVMR